MWLCNSELTHDPYDLATVTIEAHGDQLVDLTSALTERELLCFETAGNIHLFANNLLLLAVSNKSDARDALWPLAPPSSIKSCLVTPSAWGAGGHKGPGSAGRPLSNGAQRGGGRPGSGPGAGR